MKIAAIFVMILMLSSCDATSKQEPIKLKAEQSIQFKEARFACTTKDDYHEAVLHSVKEEKTKFAAMFYNSTCMSIPKDIVFKVLSVENRGEYAIIEITNAENVGVANGMFTEWDYNRSN